MKKLKKPTGTTKNSKIRRFFTNHFYQDKGLFQNIYNIFQFSNWITEI